MASSDEQQVTVTPGSDVSSAFAFIKGAIEDPTYRVGKLEAASRGVVSMAPNDPLGKAVTLMLFHSYSQLPVMQGEREVKGVATWESIGSRLLLGGQCKEVRDFMTSA